ncbi:hypothetical protein EIN_151890 [Entamoeba invadens IP1]|uniref:Arf-GAP domain-containing protein n=1 Tax=Entamoeba invadens IP1 TaxID=370355 RepID=A0A0A1U8T0_ENTIV|nr:hypothetical protein EIN_151890 [Entamoeba invadens IP1]ELP91252.1 hypothetical protein EIN_151890 [Entamoeba invadens IP1]|eukprot:XP_004258023.1 hypothetical protein EIN_151890 [Entamoeba invadens IP1]
MSERLIQKMESLAMTGDNRLCFNCGRTGTAFIVTDFNIFVCTSCSGIHREFNHRVKSVSMSNWTTDQFDKIKNSGNAAGRRIWLAKKPSNFSLPKAGDQTGIREFIKTIFVNKTYYSEETTKQVQLSPTQKTQITGPKRSTMRSRLSYSSSNSQPVNGLLDLPVEQPQHVEVEKEVNMIQSVPQSKSANLQPQVTQIEQLTQSTPPQPKNKYDILAELSMQQQQESASVSSNTVFDFFGSQKSAPEEKKEKNVTPEAPQGSPLMAGTSFVFDQSDFKREENEIQKTPMKEQDLKSDVFAFGASFTTEKEHTPTMTPSSSNVNNVSNNNSKIEIFDFNSSITGTEQKEEKQESTKKSMESDKMTKKESTAPIPDFSAFHFEESETEKIKVNAGMAVFGNSPMLESFNEKTKMNELNQKTEEKTVEQPKNNFSVFNFGTQEIKENHKNEEKSETKEIKEDQKKDEKKFETKNNLFDFGSAFGETSHKIDENPQSEKKFETFGKKEQKKSTQSLFDFGESENVGGKKEDLGDKKKEKTSVQKEENNQPISSEAAVGCKGGCLDNMSASLKEVHNPYDDKNSISSEKTENTEKSEKNEKKGWNESLFDFGDENKEIAKEDKQGEEKKEVMKGEGLNNNTENKQKTPENKYANMFDFETHEVEVKPIETPQEQEKKLEPVSPVLHFDFGMPDNETKNDKKEDPAIPSTSFDFGTTEIEVKEDKKDDPVNLANKESEKKEEKKVESVVKVSEFDFGNSDKKEEIKIEETKDIKDVKEKMQPQKFDKTEIDFGGFSFDNAEAPKLPKSVIKPTNGSSGFSFGDTTNKGFDFDSQSEEKNASPVKQPESVETPQIKSADVKTKEDEMLDIENESKEVDTLVEKKKKEIVQLQEEIAGLEKKKAELTKRKIELANTLEELNKQSKSSAEVQEEQKTDDKPFVGKEEVAASIEKSEEKKEEKHDDEKDRIEKEKKEKAEQEKKTFGKKFDRDAYGFKGNPFVFPLQNENQNLPFSTMFSSII